MTTHLPPSHHVATFSRSSLLIPFALLLFHLYKKCSADVESQLEDLWVRYEEANANRNPFQNFEYYALPLIVALGAFILRWMSDATCSLEYKDYCSRVSSGMGHIYVGIFTFLAIMSANKIRLFVDYCRQVVPVLLGMDPSKLHLKTA